VADQNQREAHEEDEERTRIPVLFIAGAQRSGSTLLDRVLGQAGGTFSAGEIRYIWENSFVGNHRCGCGAPFSDCSFWSDVTLATFERYGRKPSAKQIVELQHAIDRMRYIPALSLDLMGRGYRRRLTEYRDLLECLYASIREISGCDVVIDSTKDPSHGYLLATSLRIDLHVVHLVRDSRAVAFSWMRKRVDPARPEPGTLMPIESPIRSGAIWNVHNGLSLGLRRHAASYRRIRYEDFVASPHDVARSLLDRYGIDLDIDASVRGTIDLDRQHTLSGNPMRFEHGAVAVEEDVEWLTAMARRDRLVVTALTWPLLITFGYRPSRRSGRLVGGPTVEHRPPPS